MSKTRLLKKIEQCRNEMITLSDSYELTSEIVIQSSKNLDKLLNSYQNRLTIETCKRNINRKL